MKLFFGISGVALAAYWLMVTVAAALFWAAVVGTLVLIAKGGYVLWRWCR